MRKLPKKQPAIANITPRELGEQFKSFKVRPNNPCLCGSGRKQKHCCGDQSKIGSVKPVLPEPKPVFIYISTKYTHKKDKYFFFWRPDGKGYHFAKEEMGTFHIAYKEKDNVCSVPFATALPFFIHAEIAGRKCRVLPNTTETRKAFGIAPKDLKSTVPYQF